jgi:putative ABC transport system ATP-binding protein
MNPYRTVKQESIQERASLGFTDLNQTLRDIYRALGVSKKQANNLNGQANSNTDVHTSYPRKTAPTHSEMIGDISEHLHTTESDTQLLELRNLCKIYRLGRLDIKALNRIDLDVGRGEFLAVMGASGSGKTTLLNLIGTLDTPTDGTIILDGEDLSRLKESDKDRIRRHKIGFIYQFYNLIPVLSARENIELPMDIAGLDGGERRERIDQLLRMIGLSDRANHRPDELSGGQQQRVAIARALANRPFLILADEPTGDLDSKTGQEIIGRLRELCKEERVTVIMVTHDPVAAEHADRIIHMRDGRIEGERILDMAKNTRRR